MLHSTLCTPPQELLDNFDSFSSICIHNFFESLIGQGKMWSMRIEVPQLSTHIQFQPKPHGFRALGAVVRIGST